MPASIIIRDDTRNRAHNRSAIALVVNENFFHYDGKYQVGITVVKEEIADRSIFPSLKWQLAQLRQIAAFSQEERQLIGEYANWDSDRLNNELIANPESDAPLNRLILSLTRTDKEFTVYRYIRKYEILSENRKNLLYLPPAEGEYTYYSYLSTSFYLPYVLDQACEGEIAALMVITVPVGTAVMCIPGTVGRQEYEILLPHKTVLKIHGRSEELYQCKDKERSFLVYRARVAT